MGAPQQALLMANSGAGAPDPSFASVLALYHFDQTNGTAAPFTDNAPVTSGTTASVSTLLTNSSNPKFGPCSLRVGPNALSAPGAPIDSLYWCEKTIAIAANSPMTVEGFFNFPTAIPVNGNVLAIVSLYAGGAIPLISYSFVWRGTFEGRQFEANINGGGVGVTTGGYTPPTAVYDYLALSVTPGATGVFLWNGALVGTAFAVPTHGAATRLCIGFGTSDAINTKVDFQVDDFRVSRVQRYTGAISTPVNPFPNF